MEKSKLLGMKVLAVLNILVAINNFVPFIAYFMKRSIVARGPVSLIPLIYGIIFLIVGLLILLRRGRILIILASLCQILLSGYNMYFISRLILSHNFRGPESMLYKSLVFNIVLIVIYGYSIYYFTKSKVKEQFK